MLDAIAAPRRGNKVRTLASCSGDLLAVAEARPRRRSLKLRPQSEVVIVVTLMRAPGAAAISLRLKFISDSCNRDTTPTERF